MKTMLGRFGSAAASLPVSPTKRSVARASAAMQFRRFMMRTCLVRLQGLMRPLYRLMGAVANRSLAVTTGRQPILSGTAEALRCGPALIVLALPQWQHTVLR